MIIKSSQRAGHAELAAHLVKHQDIDGTPQTVTISGSRQLPINDNVRDALRIMQVMAKSSARCRKDIFHISLSPDQSMSDDDWDTAWMLYEKEFGLSHLAYIEVTHDKGDRPKHRHRCYERVSVETGKAVHLAHTRIRNEKVAREIEFTLGHNLTVGKHNRTVMLQLAAEGREDIVAWMKHHHAHDRPRPVAQRDHKDEQMQKRLSLSVDQVKADLKQCFENASAGHSFQVAIAEKGYLLAKGDKRQYVVLDASGGLHSPRRRIGQKAKVINDKLADLEPSNLPSVAEVMRMLRDLHRIDNNESVAADTADIPSRYPDRAA